MHPGLGLIGVQPVDQRKLVGEEVLFSVDPPGPEEDFVYQWNKDGEPINSANKFYLYINKTEPGDTGAYSCMVTSKNGQQNEQTKPVVLELGKLLQYINCPALIMIVQCKSKISL